MSQCIHYIIPPSNTDNHKDGIIYVKISSFLSFCRFYFVNSSRYTVGRRRTNIILYTIQQFQVKLMPPEYNTGGKIRLNLLSLLTGVLVWAISHMAIRTQHLTERCSFVRQWHTVSAGVQLSLAGGTDSDRLRYMKLTVPSIKSYSVKLLVINVIP